MYFQNRTFMGRCTQKNKFTYYHKHRQKSTPIGISNKSIPTFLCKQLIKFAANEQKQQLRYFLLVNNFSSSGLKIQITKAVIICDFIIIISICKFICRYIKQLTENCDLVKIMTAIEYPVSPILVRLSGRAISFKRQ